MSSDNTDTVKEDNADNDKKAVAEIVTQSFPPSHILQDGRFIYLPPPTEMERSRFFERAIAKYGLLESDMAATAASATAKEQQQQQEKEKAAEEKEEEGGDAAKKDDTAPKVHPLALASARIQGSGMNELNRAINLSTLVNTGEYFGLTNIVDPTLDLGAAVPGKAEGGAATPAAPTAAAASDATTATTPVTGAAATGAASATSATATGAAGAPAVASTPTAAAAAANAANVTATNTQAQKDMQQEQRVKAAYILKRKRAVFDKASRVLQRHQARLEAAITAQAVPDKRLKQLRPQWRLVAPEHGTRAKPHAVRPTEVIAVDVDVYDPMMSGGAINSASLVGRLASQVPRYATIELTEEFCQKEKQQSAKANLKSENTNDHDDDTAVKKGEDDGDNDDKPNATIKKEDEEDSAMDIDVEDEATAEAKAKVKVESSDNTNTKSEGKSTENDTDGADNKEELSGWTIAEPFAIADPTLGKISTDFDPNKVTYLTLQFDIEKPSSGFCMSSCLEPMTTTMMEMIKEEAPATEDEQGSSEAKNTKDDDVKDKSSSKRELPDDEQVLVSLQHSLFCAKLFESIRKELMGEDNDENPSQQQQQQSSSSALQSQNQSVVWLTSESEENYLPPPSVMVQPATHNSGAALCVVHCHSSEVKVQMDCEYTLRAKLVEADEQQKSKENSQYKSTIANSDSGSQTPQQLSLLCRSLLLHAQEAYHKHSLQESFTAAQKQREEQERKLETEGKPMGLDRIQKKDARKQPKILQSVVGLGSKMLFEQRIRKSLVVSWW